MKQNGIPRIIVTLLLSINREFVGQFLTNPENIESFSSANSSAIDSVVSAQKSFYQTQEKLSQALTKFVDSVVTAVSKDRQAHKDALRRIVQV